MKTLKIFSTATFLCALTISGLSGFDRYDDYNPYAENRFSQEEGYEIYKVKSSIPITKTITKKVRTGEDIQEKIIKRKVSCFDDAQDTNSIGLDTLIGVGLGIAAGNQFHNHKDAAKVIGGITGGLVANNIRKNNDCYEDIVTYERVPRYETISENVIVGYNNCTKVDGKKICKESNKKLDVLRIKKTYSVY